MKMLNEWLQAELDKRNWSTRELARKAKINHQSVARALKPGETIGATVARKIAETLHTPVETVFRMAGILPPDHRKNEDVVMLEHIYHLLDEDRRRQLMNYALFLRNENSG